MRILIPFLALLSSCTVIHGNKTAGTYTYASIGGNATGLKASPDSAEAASVDNAISFRELNKTTRFGIGAWTATRIAENLADTYKSVKATKTAADVSKVQAQETTTQAAISADVEKAALLAPEP